MQAVNVRIKTDKPRDRRAGQVHGRKVRQPQNLIANRRVVQVVVPIILLVSAQLVWASNWAGWRGPTGTGVSEETDLPLKWSVAEHVRWRVSLPDRGNSSPIVWGNRVFLSQAVQSDHRRTLMCFGRADGKLLWQAGVTYTDNEPTERNHPYCSGTPTTDGVRVYVCFGSAGVYGYDFAGEEVWHRDLGQLNHTYGNAVSPVLYRDLCILNFGPGATARLIALDKKTGETVWETEPPKPRVSEAELAALAESWFDRLDAEKTGKVTPQEFNDGFFKVFPPPPGAAPFSPAEEDNAKVGGVTRVELKKTFTNWFAAWDKDNHGWLDERKLRQADGHGEEGGVPFGSWSTPLVIRVDRRDELVVHFSYGFVSYDPMTGRELWLTKGLIGPIYTTPLWGDGTLVAVSSGMGTGIAIALKPGARDDTQYQQLWRLGGFKNAIGSGVIHRGHVYTISANGTAECFELGSGQRIWEERLQGPTSRNTSWSSMLLTGDRIYVPNQCGDVFVLRAGPRFELLACNSVNEPTNSSLAAADGELFLRTDKGLWCFR